MALGNFNRAFYNRKDTGGQQYKIKYALYATMTANVKLGALYAISYRMYSELSGHASMGWGYNVRYQMQEAMQASVNADTVLAPRWSMNASMTLRALPSLDVFPTYDMASNLDALCTIQYALFPKLELSGSLQAYSNAVLLVYPNYGGLYGIMSALVSSTPIREVIMSFDRITLQPGSVLVIDSDNFTVYLDGENAIDQYDGDWVEFTRQLRAVEVQSGISGPLNISILYRRKYL